MSQSEEDKREEKIEKIKRAIWIHDKLIDRFPDLYKSLKQAYYDSYMEGKDGRINK